MTYAVFCKPFDLVDEYSDLFCFFNEFLVHYLESVKV